MEERLYFVECVTVESKLKINVSVVSCDGMIYYR